MRGGVGTAAATRTAVPRHEVATPEDAFVPLVGLPASAEGGDGGPAPVAPEQPPALEFGSAAVGDAGGGERPVGRARPTAGGPELGEDGGGLLPGAGHGA
jgi:hypothetical protein